MKEIQQVFQHKSISKILGKKFHSKTRQQRGNMPNAYTSHKVPVHQPHHVHNQIKNVQESTTLVLLLNSAGCVVGNRGFGMEENTLIKFAMKVSIFIMSIIVQLPQMKDQLLNPSIFTGGPA